MKQAKSEKMQNRSMHGVVLAVLLASLLLGAQLHCCLDLSSQSFDSQFCPVCSAASTAIVTTPPSMEMAPAVDWLEKSGVTIAFPLVCPRSIAPRAPPSFPQF